MAEHAAAQQQHDAPQQQRADTVASTAAEPFPLRRAPPVPVRGGYGPPATGCASWPPRRLAHPEGRPDGGAPAGDAPLQHGQVREQQPGHAAHLAARARAALRPQHRAATVREVRARPLARDRLRTPLEAEALGQAHGEGSRFLPQDARMGV